MIRNKSLLLCFFCITLIAFSSSVSAGTEKKVRVAIVADKASGLNESPLVSLLEAKLSEADSIELLERQEISTILYEHKLSLTSLVQRDNIIKAGKLLRADAFLLLSSEESTKTEGDGGGLLRIRIVETSHGIRLVDTFEAADSKVVEQIVERIAGKVDFAVQKLTIPPEESIAIGIVDIHRVGLADQHTRLAKILPAMLSSRLGKEPRIIMLEREDLKILSDEKLLAEGENTEFWNSAVLIDGYLHQNEQTNILEMKLRAKNAAGKDIGEYEIPINSNTLSSAINNVSEKIIKHIQSQPPTESWDPAAEAQEFYLQGKLLNTNGKYINAIQLFETAYALKPDNFDYHFELFNNALSVRLPGKRSFTSHYSKAGSEYYSDLELAEIVSVLVRQLQAEYDKGNFTADYLVDRLAVPFGFTPFKCNYFASHLSASTQQVRTINQSSRKVFLETVSKALDSYRSESKDTYPSAECSKTKLVWLSADNPKDLMDNVRKTFPEIIMPPELGGKVNHLGRRVNIYHSIDFQRALVYRGSDKEEFLDLWHTYIKELSEVDDPVLKVMANADLALWYPRGSLESKMHSRVAIDTYFNDLNGHDQLRETRYSGLATSRIGRSLTHSWYRQPEIFYLKEKFHLQLIESGDPDKLRPSYMVNVRSVPQDRDSILRCVNLLERNCKIYGNSKRSDDQQRFIKIKDSIADIRNRYKSFFDDLQPSTINCKMILNKENWPKVRSLVRSFRFSDAQLVNDKLFVAFAKPGLTLAVIDLPSKKLIYLSKADCGNGTVIYENGEREKLNGFISGIAAIKQKAYVGIRDIGLMEFDLSSNSNRLLTKKDGLPSVAITSIAAVDDRLWLAYGGINKECGLVIFEPQKKRYETILCSSLNSEDSFNSGQTYVILSMAYGPNNKLFFVVGERGYDAKIDYPLQQYWGFWKINTKTKKLKHLWQNHQRHKTFENIDNYDKYWVLRGARYFIVFDPVLEKGTSIAGQTQRVLNATKQMIHVDIDTFKHGKYYYDLNEKGFIGLRTAAYHGDKIWARLGMSQLIILNHEDFDEESQIFDNNILDGQPVLRFISTPYGLVAIGEGTVGMIESAGENKQSLQKVNK